MTKQSGTVDLSSFTTDAKFRNWGLTCSTALQACGLVKTADTGQIDWASVSKPTATNTQAGYEIYRFNDALQATAPVFFRIGYGSGGVASGNSPSVWITIGTGSDGAGVITGLGSTIGAVATNSSTTAPTNTTMPYAFTHTADGYCLMHFGIGFNTSFTATGTPGMVILDRSRNLSTAAADGTGLGLWVHTSAGGPKHYAANYSMGTAQTTARNPLCGNLVSSSNPVTFATGGSIPTYQNYMYLGDGLTASMGAVGYFEPDLVGGSTFTSTPFGSSARTYMALGITNRGWSPSGTSNLNCAVAALWED